MRKFEYYGFTEKIKMLEEYEAENKGKMKECAKFNGKSFPQYMCDYTNLKFKQTIRIPNQDKIKKFDVFLKALPIFAEDNNYDIFVDYSEDELDITLKLISDYVYGDTSTEVGIASSTFIGALVSSYPDYIISADNSVMTFTFYIHLYDEEDTGEHDDELEELAKIMKGILSEEGKSDDDIW